MPRAQPLPEMQSRVSPFQLIWTGAAPTAPVGNRLLVTWTLVGVRQSALRLHFSSGL
jgi:hypothetical protein